MTVPLSEAQREAVERWLQEAAKVMRLADWSIIVSFRPPEEEAWASTFVVDGHLEAVIHVDSDLFRSVTVHEARKTLIHELVHLHLWDLDRLASELADNAGQPIVRTQVDRLVERSTDQIAHVLNESGLPWPSMGQIERATPLPLV